MRNLKKFLALVLAMMMTFSLMITVNAASEFTDAESITDDFSEAIAVLEGLEVFEGYPDKTFKPKNDITRAEAATIVYRLATGDVEGSKAHLYKDYGTFTDVTSDHWAAGYINYCANAEWIAGYGNGKFGPNDKVTGYQAAAMILRAVGYGKNNEFKGSGWQVQAANFSRTLGLLKNVNNTSYANTLNQPATRELVAEILFQAGLINTVTWTQFNGYRPGSTVQGATYDGRGLAWQNFKLNVGAWTEIDDWGRPGYEWYKNGSYTSANVVATIELEPVLDLEEKAWKECEVAEALKISTTRDYDLFVNSNSPITDTTNKYRIEATDTVTNVGGQGRVTEFYAATAHPWNGLYNESASSLTQRVVMVDTYLATVTNVTERVLDPAGHVIVPAYLYLDVYDGEGVGASATSGTNRNTTKHRLPDYSANWAYVKGDKVLVQGWADHTVGVDHTANVTAINRAAFETNRLKAPGNTTSYPNDDSKTCTAANFTNISVVKKADSKIAKQTVTYWSQDKHTVDGADYFDAITLFLDVAGTTTNSNFAWYFDEYNNIIGIDNVPDTVNYGVITSIYSAFGQGDSVTDGTAKAIATVKYANGDTGTITIDRFLVNGKSGGGHFGLTAGNHSTQPMLDSSGTVSGTSFAGNGVFDLVPVYDNSTSGNVMSATGRGDASTKVSNAQYAGWLHVAPVASINAAMDNNTTNYGVILGNMFKFVASANGTMTAIEVAGDKAGVGETHAANENTGIFEWNYNAQTNGNTGKLYKNYSYIGLTNAATADVYLDTDAYIMVKTSATTVLCLTADTLTGDVALANNSEVDWADPDGDGRAEYVYVTGSIEGTETYGLFYYNGGAAQWNGSTGTMFGWLNGEPTTLTFAGLTSFNAVKDSQSYKGHLFAVKMTNGVVTNVLNQTGDPSYAYLLANYTGVGVFTNATGNKIAASFNATVQVGNTATYFGLGSVNSKFGNPYTTATEAIYYSDTTGGTAVSYDPNTRTITAGVDTYYLNAGTKVVGLGMGVNQDGAILDYLNRSDRNDVTIVYEQNAVKSIVEIYVATDPNVTPPPTVDTSAATLAITGMGTNKITLTPTLANDTSEGMNSVKMTVSYRPVGSDTWIKFAPSTGLSVAAAGTVSGTACDVNNLGTARYYEAKVEITATGDTTGASYSYTSVTYNFYV